MKKITGYHPVEVELFEWSSRIFISFCLREACFFQLRSILFPFTIYFAEVKQVSTLIE